MLFGGQYSDLTDNLHPCYTEERKNISTRFRLLRGQFLNICDVWHLASCLSVVTSCDILLCFFGYFTSLISLWWFHFWFWSLFGLFSSPVLHLVLCWISGFSALSWSQNMMADYREAEWKIVEVNNLHIFFVTNPHHLVIVSFSD